MRTLIHSLCLLPILCLLALSTVRADETSFRADIAALTAGPHRLTGTPESTAAIEYVTKRLRDLGADEVVLQPFESLQMTVVRCELAVGGKTLPLQPMRPNGIVLPATPATGLTGKLVDIGNGDMANYPPKLPKGAVVVMNYGAGLAWREAFRLGASAVIFVKRGEMHSQDIHSSVFPVNFPRFYYEGDVADLPMGESATVQSQMTWERATGTNVIGVIRGTEPSFDANYGREAVLLAAQLDSYGEVPTRANGAIGAANCASLLEVAARLKANPPRRDIILAFFDAESQGHAGSSAFYRALDKQEVGNQVAAQLGYLEAERAFQQGMSDVLSSPNPLQSELATSSFLNRLKPLAAEHVYELNHQLSDLRRQRDAAKKAGESQESFLTQIEALNTDKDGWNNVRRTIGKVLRGGTIDDVGLSEDEKAEATKRLQVVYDELSAKLNHRFDQLAERKLELDAEARIVELFADTWFALHVSLMLDDSSRRWGAVIGDSSKLASQNDNPGLYTRIQGCFLTAATGIQGAEAMNATYPGPFEIHTVDQTLVPAHAILAISDFTHSGLMAGRQGVYNLAFGTVQADFDVLGTPLDTLASLEPANIYAQLADMDRILGAVASSTDMTLARAVGRSCQYIYPTFSGTTLQGPRVLATARGNPVPTRPVEGAVIQVLGFQETLLQSVRTKHIPAYNDFMVARTDANGSYRFAHLIPSNNYTTVYYGMAAVFNKQGEVELFNTKSTSARLDERFNLFDCTGGGVILPSTYRASIAKVMDGVTNSSLMADKSNYMTADGLVGWYVEDKVKSVKLFQENSVVLLENGPASLGAEMEVAVDADSDVVLNDPNGDGLSLMSNFSPPLTGQSASDLWRLNESRLDLLRSRGIMNSSLEELHGRAEDLMLESQSATTMTKAESLAAASFMIQQQTYGPIRKTLDDIVKAVLILLALSVPFAFALERLIIGATSIYKQIGGFVGFFLATFLLLYVSHPAFAISKTPVVIFLGFTIVVLSGLVIVIIMQKFELELKVLQGLESTVHAADVSRFGTVMAAMSMGISTMRRRPLRTALTAITIILLTFTILGFASFETQRGVNTRFEQPAPAYTGVFLHSMHWNVVPRDAWNMISGRWGETYELTRRLWLCPAVGSGDHIVISRDNGESPLVMSGLLGMEYAELLNRPAIAAQLQADPESFEKTAWIAKDVAARLDLKPGDPIRVNGVILTVGQLLDPVRLTTLRDMDDSDILPVDFSAVGAVAAPAGGRPDTADSMVEQAWQSVPGNACVITSATNAERMGAELRAISIYTPSAAEAITLAEELARTLPLPVAATRTDGVYMHYLGVTLQASGVKDLFFPILLGGMVIFGTMLGSVADREKEIYTFSALGLAPPHVAGLFFAEAMIYSVIGGLGGYLLAQGSMQVLGILANLGLLHVPEMNYSSTNAIITILLVMITVMVSAIYPAIKASRSANPGVMRSWRVPEPEGDTLSLVFPFTVSEYDITGVVSFLKEHFDSYSDTGLGVFMTLNSSLQKRDDGQVGLQAEIALAPFDLGVTESFELHSTPSEIEGINEVAITIVRMSGQPKDWQRQTRLLLDDLRRQFLIWRALPAETMESYRMQTLTRLNTSTDAPAGAPSVDGAASHTPA